MTLKLADDAKPIYACLDDSTYQPAVCEAAGRLAQDMGLPVHLFHVVDIEDKDHKKKHSDNPAESTEESIFKKLLHLEEGLAAVEDEDKQALLDSLHRKMNAQYLVQVDYEQLQGDFEESLIANIPNMSWLVMGKSGKTNEGNPEKIGEHTLNIVKQLTKPTLMVSTPYQVMSDILIAITGSHSDMDWLARMIEHPHVSVWLKDKNVHLVLINPDAMHPNHQDSPIIVADEDINETPEDTAPPEPVAGIEITATGEDRDQSIFETAIDTIKNFTKDITQTFKDNITDSPANTSEVQTAVIDQANRERVVRDLPSFQQVTSQWDGVISNLKRQVIYQSDIANILLSYSSDNQINGMILPTIAQPSSIAQKTPIESEQNTASNAFINEELIKNLLLDSRANIMLLP